ncbi:radical SAM protein [candidate division WOR-3 bacterium]|nr:radical SAM protein [candidate division WOR-3 bacterium]
MRCSYCYSPPVNRIDMTEETAHRAVEFASELYPANTGVIFFGGEPLLKLPLIKSTIAKCKQLERKRGCSFHFKISTNGLLMDEDFLQYANSVGLLVALSLDGIAEAHDKHRRTTAGEGTFDALLPKMDLLLQYQPYSNILMTVTPETVQYYAESVKFLIEKGFKYVIASLNYAGDWTDETITELQRQYRKLARLYERWTLEERKFYFSSFETKFSSHIRGEDALCYRCSFGKYQLSIAPDGDIYPCVQFVADGVSNKGMYTMGNVYTGIDENERQRLYNMHSKADDACMECAVKSRCNNNCSCLNYQTTGMLHTVSPVLCETERLLIPIVDRLGERLYRKRAPMFIQKHYNAVYPIISLIEDRN